jgi:ubiquinol-cytochrome c reductase core subunit 2
VKITAVDHGQPTTSITFLCKAGSRYETKPGVANALKNFAFKSTPDRSAITTVRESELYGGVLSSSLSREHLSLTAEFLRGDEEHFVKVLTDFIYAAKFTRHEFEEYVLPVMQSESLQAQGDPTTLALDRAHALAFRKGLGSSLFASAHRPLSNSDIKQYAQSRFSNPENLAILATGIDQDKLTKSLSAAFKPYKSASSAGSSSETVGATGYHGGESRIEGHGGPQTVFIGFGKTGPVNPALATLAAHLSPLPSVKWSQGLSPMAEGIAPGSSVRVVYLPYSDATLVGLLVQSTTTEGVKAAGTAAVKVLKEAGKAKADDIKKAVVKAKFAAASAVDGKDGLLSFLGTQAFSSSPASMESTIAGLDKVDAKAFSDVWASLLKGPRTYVAIGDINSLPYADELGL